MSTKVETAYRELRRKLARLTGSDGEATAMARLIFHAVKGWDTTALVIHAADDLSDFTLDSIERIMKRLADGEPLQYILGEATFYGMNLRVGPETLIPRPETEELVEIIVDEMKGRRDLRVLDVGTGSGAIALALSRNLEFPEITAIDVSHEALEVARDNAGRLHARIRFIEADIFSWQPSPRSLDIIVSNPPYVMERERAGMERHVVDHEPSGALFVPDDDPLIFYRRIADIGRDALAQDGRIYLEINPLCADSLADMMRSFGYDGVELADDLSRRPRFLTATLHSR